MGTQPSLAIVGNKSDLQSQARVPLPEAEAYARSIGARHSIASAKIGQGVEETFLKLTEDVLVSKAQAAGGRATSGRRVRGAPLVSDEPISSGRGAAAKGSCCGGGREP
ncbi:unnamed protein product [Polarella glacialis]|uniref:Uncharacterized protein n=1 Tax=Polarella glacialis TaxID=89957 RepID=A0A813LQ28_POLGL|nr:unnamed protein product [Polarella glacialis]